MRRYQECRSSLDGHSEGFSVITGFRSNRGRQFDDSRRRLRGRVAWIVFVFRDAVKPSMAAPGETPVSHGLENKHRSHFRFRRHDASRNASPVIQCVALSYCAQDLVLSGRFEKGSQQIRCVHAQGAGVVAKLQHVQLPLARRGSLFASRAAVNPSVEASGETSCFARPGKQVSDPLWVRTTPLDCGEGANLDKPLMRGDRPSERDRG